MLQNQNDAGHSMAKQPAQRRGINPRWPTNLGNHGISATDSTDPRPDHRGFQKSKEVERGGQGVRHSGMNARRHRAAAQQVSPRQSGQRAPDCGADPADRSVATFRCSWVSLVARIIFPRRVPITPAHRTGAYADCLPARMAFPVKSHTAKAGNGSECRQVECPTKAQASLAVALRSANSSAPSSTEPNRKLRRSRT